MKRTAIGIIVTILAVVAAAIEISAEHHGIRFTWQAFAFMALAILPWLPDFVESIKYDKLELRLRAAEQKASAAIDLTLRGGGKQNKFVLDKSKTPAVKTAVDKNRVGDDDDDPHKGKFGGRNQANGRKLTARIEPIPNEELFRRVVLRVESTDRSKPLTGVVTFHLHPTFDIKVFDELVVDGVAEPSVVSYGAFTVGAEADGGSTKLELDLTSLAKGSRDGFFDR